MAITTKNTGDTPSPAVNANADILAKAVAAAAADKAGTVDNTVKVTAPQLEQLGENNNNSGITRPGVGSAGVSQNAGVGTLTQQTIDANNAAVDAGNVALDTALENLTIADLRAGALNHKELQGLMALLGVKSEPTQPKRRWDEFSHVYQFPSAPTSFHFSFSKSGKINIPEGIYGTNDPKEIEELEAAAEVGNIWRYSPDVNYQEIAPTTKIPQPVRTDAIN